MIIKTLRALFCSHSLQQLLFVNILMMALLTTCEVTTDCSFGMCVSLIVSDVQYVFVCLLAICPSSLENFYLGLLPIF